MRIIYPIEKVYFVIGNNLNRFLENYSRNFIKISLHFYVTVNLKLDLDGD